MLDARLGEPLVLRWLEESGKRPGRLSADDLVALKRAGASDDLVATLLDRSRAATPAASSPAAGGPLSGASMPAADPARPAAPAGAPVAQTAAAPTAVTPAPVAPPPQPSASEAAASSVTPAGAATVIVSAALRYIHVAEEGEPWDLVVYLDGVPFDPVPAAPSASSAGTWTSQRAVPPGRHLLAWSQEQHRKDGKGRPRHGARFDPEPLAFELAPGEAAAIEFEYRDRTGLFLRMGGPVTVAVAQGGKELTRRESSGDPASWPKLCEEIEFGLGGRKPGFLERQELRDCLRWAEIWRGVATLPERDAVRPPVR